MPARLPLVCAVLAAVSVVIAAPAPRQEPTFRGGIDIVSVDVSVLDRHRQPVRDLTAADFTVLEDGHPQRIVAFTPVELPARQLAVAPWMPEIAPDVSTNDLAREGRLVVILIDRTVAPEQVPAARRIAQAAIDQLRQTDLAAVVYSDSGIPQNFTADRRRLRDAIDRPWATLPAGDDGSPGECYCGLCSLDTIAQVAEAFRDVPQRRKLLLFIGSALRLQAGGPCGGLIGTARDRVFRAADVANLTVYAFDPTGLQTPDLSSGSAVQLRRRSALANLTRIGDLQVLPDRTGGRLLSGNDPVRTMPELFRETGSYYVLGFQPQADRAAGRFHRIRVRVNRPDVIVQSRRGYYTPRPAATSGASAAAAAAAAGLWPDVGLPLAMTAAPVAAGSLATPAVLVTIEVAPSGDGSMDETPTPAPPPADADAGAPLHLFIGAFDRHGRALASTRQQIAASGTGPVEVVASLPLAPGHYELRAGIERSADHRTGSVYGDLVVPDFRAAPISLSGLVLERSGAPVPMGFDAVRPFAPAVPTTVRTFRASDHVRASLQIYEGVSRPILPVYVRTRTLDQDNREVANAETRILADRFSATRAVAFAIDLPLPGLAPGAYWTNVEVIHGNDRLSRDVRFSIVP